MSTHAPFTSGMWQGTVLGCLLFLIYINDVQLKVSSTTSLFVNDSLVNLIIKTTKDARILQEDLQKLQEWEREWKMSLNPTKCKIIRVTRKWSPINTTYTIHGPDLAVTKTDIYLGVTNLECPHKCHNKEGKQQLGLSEEKSHQLPQGIKGTELPVTGQTHPRLCNCFMGSSYQCEHLAVGGCPEVCGKIHDGGLQTHQEPQSDDCWPWMISTSVEPKPN